MSAMSKQAGSVLQETLSHLRQEAMAEEVKDSSKQKRIKKGRKPPQRGVPLRVDFFSKI